MKQRKWKVIADTDDIWVNALEFPHGCLVHYQYAIARQSPVREIFMPNLCQEDVRDLFFEREDPTEPEELSLGNLTPEQIDELEEVLDGKIRSCLDFNCHEEADDIRKIMKNLGFRPEN